MFSLQKILLSASFDQLPFLLKDTHRKQTKSSVTSNQTFFSQAKQLGLIQYHAGVYSSIPGATIVNYGIMGPFPLLQV